MVRKGEIIELNFDPQAGHEQKGRRPALVISNDTFNKFSKMVMVCPITHTNKRHPFHIQLDGRTKTNGFILCDQSRILDIHAREFKFVESIPDDILAKVSNLIISFLK